MPAMPRTDNKAREIAFNILGVPSNMEGFYPKGKKKSVSIQKAMEKADVQEHFRRSQPK